MKRFSLFVLSLLVTLVKGLHCLTTPFFSQISALVSGASPIFCHVRQTFWAVSYRGQAKLTGVVAEQVKISRQNMTAAQLPSVELKMFVLVYSI